METWSPLGRVWKTIGAIHAVAAATDLRRLWDRMADTSSQGCVLSADHSPERRARHDV